jgi:hypothetical protein
MTTNITDSQIREYILTNPDHIKVTIKRNGDIHVRTNKQRGDGGKTPWTMYWGDRSDAVRNIQSDNN